MAQSIDVQSNIPIKATYSKPLPYQVAAGTFISLVFTRTDAQASTPNAAVARVTTDIYDRFGNITIPKGSTLLGQYIKKFQTRTQIFWTTLQISGVAKTITLEPPINCTETDGSSGVVKYELGMSAGGIVVESFVIPQ